MRAHERKSNRTPTPHAAFRTRGLDQTGVRPVKVSADVPGCRTRSGFVRGALGAVRVSERLPNPPLERNEDSVVT